MKATEKGFITKNFQWNRGASTEKDGIYNMECLLCANKYTVDEMDIQTKKCPACQDKR